jgi:hypothetical protein
MKAVVTGADSGIGRAVAIAYAREGADVLIAYLNEHDDARETSGMLSRLDGRRCWSQATSDRRRIAAPSLAPRFRNFAELTFL